MDRRTARDVAAAVAACAAVLLLVDLSLGWFDVHVSTAGVVDISATSSGWSGMGVVAGLLAIALLVSMIRPLRREGAVSAAQALTTGLIGLGVAGFTIGAALGGSASVTAPTVAVEVGSRLWPAYAGIVLGIVVAAGAITAAVLVLRGETGPSRVVHAGG